MNTPILSNAKLTQMMPNMFPNPKMATNYKTVICKYWQQTGTCKYQENCSFAHGDPEVRTAIDNAELLVNQQIPFAQSWDPLKNPQFEMAIRIHQLAKLCVKLMKLHKNNEEMVKTVKGAEALLAGGDINAAGYILQKIVYSPSEDPSVEEKHTSIVKDIVRFAEDAIEDLMNNRFPEELKTKPRSLELLLQENGEKMVPEEDGAAMEEERR